MENKASSTRTARPSTARSPSYPMLSLPEAIERARILWDKQRKNAVSPTVAAQTLGYKNDRSGTAGRVIAALIQYGLLNEEGKGTSRMVRLTEDARALVILEPSDPDWQQVIRAAALRPKIYADMVARWPETLPPDQEIRRYLSFERQYNQDTVHELIKSFKRTYEFAGLSNEGATIGDTETDDGTKASDETLDATGQFYGKGNDTGREQGSRKPPPPVPPDFVSYTLPIANNRRAYLHTPSTLSAEDFELMGLTLKLIQRSTVGTRIDLDFEVLEPPKVRQGPAIWRTSEFDLPIKVLGYLGLKNNRHFASIEESTAGVPLDEIVYDEQGSEMH